MFVFRISSPRWLYCLPQENLTSYADSMILLYALKKIYLSFFSIFQIWSIFLAATFMQLDVECD